MRKVAKIAAAVVWLVLFASIALAEDSSGNTLDSNSTAASGYFHASGPSREEIIQKIKKEQENYWKKPLSYEDLKKRQLVEKVPNMVLPGNNTTGYRLVPYRIRRNRWDNQITFTASEYSPANYQTDFLNPNQASFSDIYGTSGLPLLEGSYMIRYNFTLGAIGLEAAYGFYKTNSKAPAEIGNAQLSAYEDRIGLRYIMDTIWREPVIAPYIMGGAYQFQYTEQQGNAKLNGRTTFAPYWGAGALFQLNWTDANASASGYEEAGIENWYVFTEGREYLSSGQTSERDFSSPFSLSVGLSVEL